MQDSTHIRSAMGHHRSGGGGGSGGTNKRRKQSSLLTSYFQPVTTVPSRTHPPPPEVRSSRITPIATSHVASQLMPSQDESTDEESVDDTVCLAELARTKQTKESTRSDAKVTTKQDLVHANRCKHDNIATPKISTRNVGSRGNDVSQGSFQQGTYQSSLRSVSPRHSSLSLRDFGVVTASEGTAAVKGPPRKQKPPLRSTAVAGKKQRQSHNAPEAPRVQDRKADPGDSKAVVTDDMEPKRTFSQWRRLDQSSNIVHALIRSTYQNVSIHTKRSCHWCCGTRFAFATQQTPIIHHVETARTGCSIGQSDVISTESLAEKLSRFRSTWSVAPNLRLVQHADMGEGNLGTASKLAWDSTGELLAVAFDCSSASSGNPVVAIYNWDTVVATDYKSRSQRQRNVQRCGCSGSGNMVLTSSAHTVEPVLTIPIPTRSRSTVAVLEWNPFNVDELVVGLRSSESVLLFDLGDVGEWLESYAKHGRLERDTFPPCLELRCCTDRTNSQTSAISCDSSFRFVGDGDQALLSIGTEVVCWKIGGTQRDLGVVTPYWKYRYKDTITCMEPLGADMIVLGTCIGRLALLNWKIVVFVSFSSSPSPTLVEDWTSYCAGPGQTSIEIPSPLAMGIRRICIQKSKLLNSNVLVAMVWTTTCGWVLSTKLEVPGSNNTSTHSNTPAGQLRRVKRCELLFQTKPMRWINAKGETVDRVANKVWTVPSRPIQTAVTDTTLIWQKVDDDVTQLIPHADQRVLQSDSVAICNSEERPTIQLIPITRRRGDGRAMAPNPVTISLCERSGTPTTLAAHPNHEWIAVGTVRKGVYLVHSTSEIRVT